MNKQKSTEIVRRIFKMGQEFFNWMYDDVFFLKWVMNFYQCCWHWRCCCYGFTTKLLLIDVGRMRNWFLCHLLAVLSLCRKTSISAHSFDLRNNSNKTNGIIVPVITCFFIIMFMYFVYRTFSLILFVCGNVWCVCQKCSKQCMHQFAFTHTRRYAMTTNDEYKTNSIAFHHSVSQQPAADHI